MKGPTREENETASEQRNIESKEWINQTLRKIHRKMVELFGIDFTYFADIKIVKQSDILKQFTERLWNNLKENGVVYSNTQWKQIHESLSENSITGFFENLAFYNPKNNVLYMNEKMIINHQEKIIPVCTHELSEKLLSTYLPSHLKTPARVLVEAYVKAEKTNNPRKIYQLFTKSTDLVFKTVFKEGVCEAIALQTLRQTNFEMEAASLEKELEEGHLKCIEVLFWLDKAKRKTENMGKHQTKLHEKRQVTDVKDLIKEPLRGFQIIKGISYYLGYPLGKAVLEKYGIKGVKLALEKYPPNNAQYFANPQTYLTNVEKLRAFNE